MSPDLPAVWPGRDGAPVACREKLRMLAENEAELLQVLQDVFEDAVLMGVDEGFLRARLHELADSVRAPGA